ncbi:IS256 family transposase [Virgibacillus sp. 179-BFC.A HS]|uniref:Mutator family transposase n=1 Tax=Tigheibacillus jepli TaxID=3035914 RepID=A0ABU5CD49_9BACI|nr:IS256 family transposase [Virgibacillus sp. 179-BFC.A HS]MDY0404248.1 IS256 family transposase [Virgibacillus sp. 179-BFC.A HS]
MAKIKRDEKSVKLAKQILEDYQPENVEDMQNALKDIFGPMFEAMLKGEMSHHLGYESNDKAEKQTNNRRNGYGKKTVKTSSGEVDIQMPRDRDGSFDSQVIPKRKRDVSAIEDKVIAMYARGMSQRDISSTIEDIYGFSVSHDMVSDITDSVLPELEEWQTRPLHDCYAFVFVDCMYTTIRNQYETKKYAVYTILGYTMEGHKEILGLWLNETESKHKWMQIFDEIKARGVEDIFFLSMDGVSGLEEGARAIFPNVIVQRCMVHLIRNSIKYVPSKDYKPFTKALKKVYGAPSLKACLSAFESFKQQWAAYPGAIDVWTRNFQHVEQLFDYGSAIRKVMYTTNAVESIHSSFRKVTKKGAFPNENALLKVLYLRVQELESKWKDGQMQNWAMVMNQFLLHDHLKDRVLKYLE